MSLLELTELSHTFGDKILYQNAGFSLNKGEHVGITGQNGVGKSTLISICTGRILPDQGSVSWQPHIRIGYLDQYAEIEKDITVHEFLRSAFDTLYQIERKMNTLYESAAQNQEVLAAAAACYAELEANNFYTIDMQIEKVAAGLGLNAIGLDRKISQISGGQRAKVILGKLLLENPEVLLLDEPTNFLDREHVDWLSDMLSASDKAFMVVSHDYHFLDKISNQICDIQNGMLHKYAGSYTAFLKQKKQLQEDYFRRYQAQQKEIQKTEEYIRRNIAGNNSKNAKGRRKQLERVIRLKAPENSEVHRPVFHFQEAAVSTQECLRLENLSIGYQKPLLSELSFSMKGGEKAVITGFNGIGKSTLMKTLVKQIPALSGSFHFTENIIIGYYEQDLNWADGHKTPIEIVNETFPALTAMQIRKELYHCGISNKQAIQQASTLSGGEQAKVKMCLLSLKPCNFLLLDEPTNHLDGHAKEALKTAIMQFRGSVLLVSHEEAFYRDWAERIIDAEKMR